MCDGRSRPWPTSIPISLNALRQAATNGAWARARRRTGATAHALTPLRWFNYCELAGTAPRPARGGDRRPTAANPTSGRSGARVPRACARPPEHGGDGGVGAALRHEGEHLPLPLREPVERAGRRPRAHEPGHDGRLDHALALD